MNPRCMARRRQREKSLLVLGLFFARVVPAADVGAALDLVGLDRFGLRLHPRLLDGLPRISGVAVTQAPLADDLVRLADLGNRVLEVAVALLGRVRANGANLTLGPLV